MSTRGLARRATAVGYATPTNAPIYVDSDDNRVKVIPAGSGTDEIVLQEASGAGSVYTPTGAVVLTAAQSGLDIYLNAAAGFAITLPAVAAGLRFRFTVAAAFATTAFTIVTPGGANLIFGQAVVDGAIVAASAEDTITFVDSAELPGDFVELWSDGTSWFVFGAGTTAGSITFTAS